MIQSQVYSHLIKSPETEILAFADSKESKRSAYVARFLGYDTFVLPDFRANIGDDLRSYQDELFELTLCFQEYLLSKSKKKLLIAPVRTLQHGIPKREFFDTFTIAFADKIDLNTLKEKLYNWGYTFVDVVEVRGEVSIRGDIIDIYSKNYELPVRISFFDEDVESIRFFDPITQKSDPKEIESVEIYSSLFSLDSKGRIDLEDGVKNANFDLLEKDVQSVGYWLLRQYFEKITGKLFYSKRAKEEYLEISDFLQTDLFNLDDFIQIEESQSYFDITPKDIKSLVELHRDKKIRILSINEALLKQHEIYGLGGYTHITSPEIVNIIGKEEIILSLNKEVAAKKQKRASIILDELKPSDYVVHQDYGIGIFEGIVQASVLGSMRDFVSLKYQGEDKLLLPVENLDVIDRYIADSGTLPVLDRLGKGSFARLKEKVREKLLEIASDIIKLAAKRELSKGKVIDTSLPIIARFQQESGFEYTDDQQKAIEELFSDIKSGCVMDRLISGDVGFGKTEVALNAIFVSVLNGFQALFISPTTLLSYQHYRTLKSRLDSYDIKVARIDRFVSAKDKKAILQGFEEGKIDVIVGTHSLLGVKSDKLALAIVDEEHKFGVKQKEKIKELREDIHLLSMSATPIPRTLNMALSKIKGLSAIMTPPKEREPVRTFVKEYSESLVKEAVNRELRRGGQIFYIHNNIATIEQKKKELLRMLPTLNIAVLHSQVDSEESEEIMLHFGEGKYNLMLSTSIVESGIHLPNANTILIDSSDRFGIADLHQLRGRVGRGSKEGFCYFLVKEKESITEDAKRRLIALENNSALGSGSVLAFHDLEIRGGGNLLGEAQSGHIKNIGYSLYLKMLEDALSLLSGQVIQKGKEVDIKLSITAYLSPELITSERVRLELYRRLSKCESASEVYGIEDEITQRFGKPDATSLKFLSLIIIKILASAKGIKNISNYKENVTVFFEDGKKETLKSKSKDDDDILECVLSFLRK